MVLLAFVAGCPDDEPTADPYKCMAAGGAGCFEFPTDPLAAADKSTGAAVAPNLSCPAYQVVTSPGPVTLMGTTTELIQEVVVPSVRLEVFSDLAMAQPLGDTTSDDTGLYSLTIDSAPSLSFTRSSADGKLPFYFVHQRVDVSVPEHNIEFETADRMAVGKYFESVGDRFLPNKSQIIGFALDCNGNRLINTIVNIAPSSGMNGSRLFEPGVRTYYTTASDANKLGLRTMLMQTTQTGGFAASNLAPGHHFVQMWGFPTDADLLRGGGGLKMLAELEVIVPSSEIVLVIPMYGRL